MTTAAEKFRALLREHTRYEGEAYNFLYEALDYTNKNVIPKGRKGHVSGQELLEGVRRHAIEQYGCMAGTVLESWGITKTDDVGKMVFYLVEKDLMGAQDSDREGDFHDVYDFGDVFDLKPVIGYNHDREEWLVAYVPRSNFGKAPGENLERTA